MYRIIIIANARNKMMHVQYKIYSKHSAAEVEKVDVVKNMKK